MLKTHGAFMYLTFVGIALLAMSWAVRSDSEAPAAAFATIGAGALLMAPFASRIYGNLRIGPIEMNLRERATVAIDSAPIEIVNAVVPLLEDPELAAEIVTLPARLEGHSLTAPELTFVRKELNVQVVGVRPPTSARWLAGGEVSEVELPRNAALLAVGSRTSLRELRERLSALSWE